MRKQIIIVGLVAAVLLGGACSSTKHSGSSKGAVSTTTFNQHVIPIIQASCAPCHIEGKGNKGSLNLYAKAAAEADDMIRRIQLNPGERGFMPMRHEKLSDSAIAVFVQWKQGGLKE